MDLFLDKYYEKDCGNKINYYKLLKGTNSTITDDYTFIGELTGKSIYQTDNRVVLIIGSNLADIHLYKNSDKEYCYEIMIAADVKKFVL